MFSVWAEENKIRDQQGIQNKILVKRPNFINLTSKNTRWHYLGILAENISLTSLVCVSVNTIVITFLDWYKRNINTNGIKHMGQIQ